MSPSEAAQCQLFLGWPKLESQRSALMQATTHQRGMRQCAAYGPSCGSRLRSCAVSLLVLLPQSLLPVAVAVEAHRPPPQLRSPGTSMCWDSGLKPRLQWESNDGYCGEVSVVMALMKFGSYMSQFDVRAISTDGGNQSTDYYLVGENDGAAAQRLRLSHIEYPNRCVSVKPRHCSMEYLAWVKKMVRRGHAVTITVYMNNFLFYGDTNPRAGEPDYDHIVSVLSLQSEHDDDVYHEDDKLTLGDHGLWQPGPTPQYNFTYTFGELQGSRKEANAPEGNVYYVPDRYPSDTGNFAIAHTGPLEKPVNQSMLLPIRVDTNVCWERPPIADGSQQRPPPMPLTLTVTVFSLSPGVNYSLYLFDNATSVPVRSFNSAGRVMASQAWHFVGEESGQYSMALKTKSDMQAFFRAVRSDAP
eukprot:SAG31_NODE_329_length_17643_cov_10.377793_7_plen_415_part_00